MVELYGDVVIEAMRDATYFFAGCTGLLLFPNMIVWTCREFCTIDVVEFDG
jgi:hypothetical protein